MSTKSFICLVALLALAAAGRAQTVTVTPTSLTFNYQQGAAKLPSAQSVAVKPSSGTPTYTAAITSSNSEWLAVAPNSGKLPATLSFYVNPTTLPVGQYTAIATVTVTGVTNPIAINMTLNVTAAPATLQISATSLTFSSPPAPAPQTIQLGTTGIPISFTVTAAAAWLSVTPTVGVVLPGEQATLTVSADPSSLAPQSAPYNSKLTITSGTGSTAKTQSVTVSFAVNNSAPTITNVWPATLPVGAAAQTVTITGTNFYSATVATIQGVVAPLTGTLISPTVIEAVIPAAQLAVAGTLNLVVTNPAPGGSSAPFPVAVANIPTIGAVTNVASYASAAVSPGELVTIFGSDIGPVTPATMTISNGFVTTSLGGVTLTIDGQPAPLLYVSQNQVTAQVPYEVTVASGDVVALTNGSNAPANSTVNVVAAVPGIFTADGSGVNGAAALNFDPTTSAYSLNTANNPVKLGGIVILYLTGEGDYNPTLSPRTGLIIPATLTPLPQLNPLPTVTIGGAAALVSYAGPLVGSILGLLQINCTVPATATTGQSVPVVVSIGGVNTQSNVSLSVHP